MVAFVRRLAADGRVVVGADPPADDDRDVAAAIGDWDALARQDAPGVMPALSTAVAAWAAGRLHAACRFLVHRQFDEPAVLAAMSVACPAEPTDPAACWSADLFLRHLPAVARLARGVANDDPLVAQLAAVGRRWPLSSVGMADVGRVDAAAVVAHDGLRRLYVDRIIAAADVGRLADPAVRQAVAAAVGDHGAELAPAVWAAAVREGR